MKAKDFRSTLCISLKFLTKYFQKVKILSIWCSVSLDVLNHEGGKGLFFFLIDTLQHNKTQSVKHFSKSSPLSDFSDGGRNNCRSSKSCRARSEIRAKKEKNMPLKVPASYLQKKKYLSVIYQGIIQTYSRFRITHEEEKKQGAYSM